MKKHVITGGPCSGKSSVICELKKRGFHVLEEIAKKVIIERNCFKVDKHEIIQRQNIIYSRYLKAEEKFDSLYGKEEHLFMDRCLIDTVFYSIYLANTIPDGTDRSIFYNRYDAVFLMEMLAFKKEGFRLENNHKEAKAIHKELAKYYADFGYNLIIVPVMNVEERADFILESLKINKLSSS